MSVLNKQDALNSIKKRTAELIKSKRWSDCSFRVGTTTANRKVFEAHKLILSMASPVFEAMFHGHLAEKKYPINVSDVESQTFAILMEYMYTDEINITTFDEAVATCYAAEKYMLTPIVDHCVTYIKDNLSETNVLRAYEFAKIYEKKELTECCIQTINSNINLILDDPGFVKMNINTLTDIFHMNDLELDTDLPLFNALERYANANKSQKDDCKDSKVYRKLLKTIRFLSMTPKEFADGPSCSKLLQQDEKFAILMNITNGDVKKHPMPKGFTTNKCGRRKSSKKADGSKVIYPYINRFKQNGQHLELHPF